MRFIGIDPGKGGGIAVLETGGSIVEAFKMPTSNRALLDKLGLYARLTDTNPGGSMAPIDCYAVLEFVRSSPQMGVASAFTFGWGLGGLEMALEALRIPYSVVTPQTWQIGMECRSGGDKNVTKLRAQERWPAFSSNITHAIADALLIAEFGRQHKLGLVGNKPTRRV